MKYTRREAARLALASIPAARALAAPNSRINGVQIGVITYSFRQGVAAKDLIPVMNKLGISEVELMSNHCEELAGAPAGPAPRPPLPFRIRQLRDILRLYRRNFSPR